MMRLGIGVGVGRQRFSGGFADSYSSRVLADGGTIEALSCVANASTLLQQASLLFIPSGYKAGVAYSALPNNGNGDLTWSRNSTANRTNSSGVIESVGTNVPRLSYMYGSCPSALLEPQRTNLALYSEQFNNAAWSKSNSTISANTTTAPNGTLTADTIAFSTAGYVVQSFTHNGLMTFSLYAKYIATQWLCVENFNSVDKAAWFDLQNGVVGSTINGATSTITNVGDGWYRCTVTMTAISGSASQYAFFTVSADSSFTRSGSAYFWGAQIEQGAYATTYIPTTSASATRLADTFTRNNIYTNGLISASGGTWYVELKNNVSYTRDAGSEGLFIADTSIGTTNSLQIIAPLGGGRLRINKRIATIGTSLYNTLTDNLKIAIKWNGTTADVFVNGVKVVSATAFTTTNMEFLNGLSADVPKFIQTMALYNTPLSDSDCITLTT